MFLDCRPRFCCFKFPGIVTISTDKETDPNDLKKKERTYRNSKPHRKAQDVLLITQQLQTKS